MVEKYLDAAHLQEDSINDTAGAQFVTNERRNEGTISLAMRSRVSEIEYRGRKLHARSPFSFLRAARARCGKHSMHKKHSIGYKSYPPPPPTPPFVFFTGDPAETVE